MKIEIEDYNGNTMMSFKLENCNIADVEEDSIRIQSNNKKIVEE